MATQVIMPALGMAQETGTLVRWLKVEGETVRQGEAIAEIQTDKAMVELEARASGILARMTARDGEDVPVGQPIAMILSPEEAATAAPSPTAPAPSAAQPASIAAPAHASNGAAAPVGGGAGAVVEASPLASRMAAEYGVDLRAVRTDGRRVQKADILAYLETQRGASGVQAATDARLRPASPKARRLAGEHGIDLAELVGTGPDSAVLANDVLVAVAARPVAGAENGAATVVAPSSGAASTSSSISPIWRIMAERTTQSWQQIPHFFLLREVNASRLVAWRDGVRKQHEGVTYTDLLVKVVAETLRTHPRMNASWQSGSIVRHAEVNVGIAVATDDGLVVPVIHGADTLSLAEITERRRELVRRAQAGKQRPDDLAGATFTISNLGMYGVDAFNAIVPGPQAGILAVGRIAERVVPLHGVPAIQPVMVLSLSCDHRVVDGARGAEFISALADLVEEPLALLG